MPTYEISFAMNFKIPDKQKNEKLNKIKEYISENGTISDIYDYGIRKLYRKLKKHSKAHFHTIYFDCTADKIQKLKEICYTTEEILLFRIMDVTIPIGKE